jgi:hypothetical protein
MRAFIFLLISIISISCKKENSKKWTEVKISATNYMTGEPISDITCGVFTIEDGFLFNDKTIALDQKQMENGVYEFGFKAKKNQTYWAEASFEILKYHVLNFSNYMPISNNTINEFKFEMVPFGNLKLDIQNQACFDANDKLIFKRENLSIPDDDTDWSTERMGCYSYSSLNYFSVPIGTHKYTWQVTKNAITTEYFTEIVVNEGDYKTVQIYY